MNLKETVDLIQETARKAAGAVGKCVVLPVEGMPDHQRVIVRDDGSYNIVTLDPQPRSHELSTLDEAAAYIASQATDKTIVWFDRNAVVVVLDDTTRRDRATLDLILTPEIKLLMSLEASAKWFDQVSFRRLLRVDLASCRRDDVLLNWVSAARFNTSGSTGGVISATKESLGKDINDAAISSAGEFPEEIGLQVRVFDDHRLRETWGVKCAVELDIRNASFRLTPLPLEIHNAIESEVDVIGDKLRDKVEVPCFRGRP